jgi:agmatinase
MPWEVTTSYRGGTSRGPKAIYEASMQLDLFDRGFGAQINKGVTLLPEIESTLNNNDRLKPKAQELITHFNQDRELDSHMQSLKQEINESCESLQEKLRTICSHQLGKGKTVAVLGGDHSCPLGLLEALALHHPEGFDIFHVDAHADLRKAYQGFTHSHASIFFNALERTPPEVKLTQVAIRDFCEEEFSRIESDDRINCFYDRDIQKRILQGESWRQVSQPIVENLGNKVYISLDVDGLEPRFCPSTGTPVPGGLNYNQVIDLIEQIAKSGREIIGFDLCEVSPNPKNEWDAIVGARLLYQLCGWTLKTKV